MYVHVCNTTFIECYVTLFPWGRQNDLIFTDFKACIYDYVNRDRQVRSQITSSVLTLFLILLGPQVHHQKMC